MANAVLLSYLEQAEWRPLKSSNLAAYWFQADFGYLWVKFKSGTVYLYEQVPKAVAEGLGSAPSAGQYLYYVIRAKGTDGRYPYRKVV